MLAYLGDLFVIDSRIARSIPAGADIAIRLADHGVTLIRE